mgnify:CR=1 FL=1
MYPLNMKLQDGIGFAVANDENEHDTLAAAGYGPARTGAVASALATQADIAASVRGQLDAAGISYRDGAGLTKLVALLPMEYSG